MIGHKMQC